MAGVLPRRSWSAWHLAYSVRHLQMARSPAERSAIAHGLWDGVRGRLGRNSAYERGTGEYSPVDPVGGTAATVSH